MSKDSAIAQVEAIARPVPRQQMVVAIETFLGSYPARSDADIDRRLALFAADAKLEDPVGAPPHMGQAGLRAFFEGAVADGWIIHMKSERILASGSEGISLTRASWGKAGTEPAKVFIVHNFIFDANGKIKTLRIFFDETTVG